MKAMKVQTPALDKKNGEQGVRTTIYKKGIPTLYKYNKV